MLPRILDVARPDDWMGWVSVVAVRFTLMSVTLGLALVELPGAFSRLGRVEEIALRLALIAVAFVAIRGIAKFVYALLPGSPVLLWGTLYFRRRGRILAISAAEITELYVETRSAGETFVLRTETDAVIDLCPVHWPGAGRLHSSLSRRMAKAG